MRPERFSAYTTSRAVTVFLHTLRNSLNTELHNDLPLGVLSVCDGVPDDVLEEDLEDTTSLLIDEARDTLHTATAGETTDSLWS